MIAWLVTEPNPYPRGGRHHTHGADDGRVGWRLHAVEVTGNETEKELRWKRALCGLQPRHGWGLDLFVDEECDRCWRAVEKTGDEAAMAELRRVKSGR